MKTFTEKWDLSPCFSEVELRYATKGDRSSKAAVCSPDDAREFFMSIWNQDTLELREEFYVLLLNNAKQSLGWCKLSSGGRTATIVEVSQVVALALLGNAHSVIVAHNHPSGTLRPSGSDIRLTNKIATALKVHDLELNDHLIITKAGYYSFRLHGMINAKPIST